MTQGCGLCLKKPLTRGQYLTRSRCIRTTGLRSVQCDVVQVQRGEKDQAGLAFLWMSLEHDRRLRRLCSDRLGFEVED